MKSPIAWRSLLEKKEYSPVISRLQHMAAHHRMLGHCSDTSEREDIPYDAFLWMLEEGTFDWYLKHTEMSDLEIDRRIYTINLTNFLSARNRKRNPEEWRLARRISTLVKKNSSFRCFVNGSGVVRLGERVYGLTNWPDDKPVKDPNLLPALLNNVGVRPRSGRQVGCTGDADLVISNEDLHLLIIEIFEATDSPTRISVLRPLVLSKLTSFGNYYVYLEEDMGDVQNLLEKLTSEGEEPDAQVDEKAEIAHLTELCDKVLDLQASRYHQLLRKEFRIDRMFKGLQLLYFDHRSLTQLAIANEIGVSDSLVSAWKLCFEADVRALKLSLKQLRIFNVILKDRLQKWIPPRFSGHGKAGSAETLLRSLDSLTMSKLIAQLPKGMAKVARLFYLVDPRPSYAEMAQQLGLKSSTSINSLSTITKQRLVLLHKGEYKSKRRQAKPKKKKGRTDWAQEFNDRFYVLSEKQQRALVAKLGPASRQVMEASLFFPPGSKKPTANELAERFGTTRTNITSLRNLGRKRIYDLMSERT